MTKLFVKKFVVYDNNFIYKINISCIKFILFIDKYELAVNFLPNDLLSKKTQLHYEYDM